MRGDLLEGTFVPHAPSHGKKKKIFDIAWQGREEKYENLHENLVGLKIYRNISFKT